MNFEEKDEKNLKGLSKAMYIIAKIMKVFSIIGIVFCTLFLVTFYILIPNIKIDTNNKTISVYKNEIKYELNDKLTINGELVASDLKDIDIEEINNFLNHDNKYIVGLISYIFIYAIISLIVIYILFNYTYKLFKNIYEKDSPFNSDNISYIYKIGIFLGVSFILTDLSGLLLDLLFKINNTLSVNLFNYVYVLIVFIIYYIFKYGYTKEKKES